mmetsp:Transcript_16268/g.41494  ORF Transcript_16268/g.41494 Transcript_16268/m.41494 type:complete len:210 (+) Transcript_16268:648-1277(+)
MIAALEEALEAHPTAQVIFTGHSMGGTLATLAALDLLLWPRDIAPPGRPVACITFGSSRSFNGAFRSLTDLLQRRGRLLGLRIVCAGDIVPRIPFDVPFGCVHAFGPRLLLNPRGAHGAPAALEACASPTDADQRLTAPDPQIHTLHAALLEGAIAPGRKQTVPSTADWPLADMAACGAVWPCLGTERSASAADMWLQTCDAPTVRAAE